jgi:fatty aldehyde-generating acyl-ACP reductase
VVDVPGEVDFGFDSDFPGGQVYACMAETMVLAMESRYESYTLGRELSLDRVAETTRLADKHGFGLSGLRSFEQVVGEEMIEKVRQRVCQKRLSRDQGHPPRDTGGGRASGLGRGFLPDTGATWARPT